MIAYRTRSLYLDESLIATYIHTVHAPIEKYYCDHAVHRIFGIDVEADEDIEDLSSFDIEDAVEACMKDDIEAVSRRRV